MNKLLAAIITISLILSAEAYASQVTLSSYYPSPSSNFSVMGATTANFEDVFITNGLQITPVDDLVIINNCADPTNDGKIYNTSIGLVVCQYLLAELLNDWAFDLNTHILSSVIATLDPATIVRIPNLYVQDTAASPAYPIHMAVQSGFIAYDSSATVDGSWSADQSGFLDPLFRATLPRFYVDPLNRIIFLGGSDETPQNLGDIQGTNIIALGGGALATDTNYNVTFLNATGVTTYDNNMAILGTPRTDPASTDASAGTNIVNGDNASFTNYARNIFYAPMLKPGSYTANATGPTVDIYDNDLGNGALKVRGAATFDTTVAVTGAVTANSTITATGDITTSSGSFRKIVGGNTLYGITSNVEAEFYFATFTGATATRTAGSIKLSMVRNGVGDYTITYGGGMCTSLGTIGTPTSAVSMVNIAKTGNTSRLQIRTFAGTAIDGIFDLILVCYK